MDFILNENYIELWSSFKDARIFAYCESGPNKRMSPLRRICEQTMEDTAKAMHMYLMNVQEFLYGQEIKIFFTLFLRENQQGYQTSQVTLTYQPKQIDVKHSTISTRTGE